MIFIKIQLGECYMKKQQTTEQMALTALMLSLVLITTMSIRLPSPFTQGYVHLGDTMIFLSVMLLGKNKGALAAGLGSRLADVLGGYTAYAPRTFVIKFLMAYIMGWFIQISAEKQRQNARIVSATEIMGMVLGGSEMVLGYALVDGFFAGNFFAGFLGAPFNIAQFSVGMVLAVVCCAVLKKTPLKQFFYYSGQNETRRAKHQ